METLKETKTKKIEGTGGAIHQYSQDEVRGYVNLVNSYLKDDDLCANKLPINPDNDELFGKLGDGFIFAKLINRASPGTIDLRALNTKGVLNIFQLKENLNLIIQSAKAIGCKIVSIFPESILEKREHIILGMLWQILKLCVLANLNLKHNPYLARLLGEDENLEDFKNLPPENALLRWFNFHLEKAKHSRRVANFSSDLQDAVNYTILLHQLDPQKCDLSGLSDDLETRASKVITNAIRLGVDAVIRPSDITSGHPRLNLLFASLIYAHIDGLESQDPALKELFESAKMLEEKENVGDTREERAFRMWTNCLDLTDGKDEPFFMNNLYDDVQDGVILLKICEAIAHEGIVDWKKANLVPNNQFRKTENCNQVIEIGKKLGFSLVGIGGNDIVNKNKKFILAVYWQMIRMDTLNMIGKMSEEELLKWANSRVKDVPAVKSFHDPSLRTCKFIFSLLNSIESRAINWEYVTPGETEEQVENNAKYALSVARRIGATIFCVWEDIRDVKPKMIMTILAALKKIAEGEAVPRKRSGDIAGIRKASGDLPTTPKGQATAKTTIPSTTKPTSEFPPKQPTFLGGGGPVKPSDLLKQSTPKGQTEETKPVLFSSKPSDNVKPSSTVSQTQASTSESTTVKPSALFSAKPSDNVSVKPSSVSQSTTSSQSTTVKPAATTTSTKPSWLKDTSKEEETVVKTEEVKTNVQPVQKKVEEKVPEKKKDHFSFKGRRGRSSDEEEEEDEDDGFTKASDFLKPKPKEVPVAKPKVEYVEAHNTDAKLSVSNNIKAKSSLFK